MPIPLSTTQLLAVASEVLTVPAAPSSSLDAARRWTIVPQGGGADRVVMVALAAQGIVTTDLTISIESLRGSARVLPLPPSLRLDELLVIGDEHEGVQLTIRNKRQAEVPVTIWLAALTRQELDRYVSGEIAGLPAVTANYVVRSEDLAGAAITTPLADVGGRPPWYDRTPVPHADEALVQNTGPHSLTQRMSITVPTGKKILVTGIVAYVQRRTAASAVGEARCDVVSIGDMRLLTNNVGDRQQFELSPDLLIASGQWFALFTADSSTGGTVDYYTSFVYTEFDL